MKKFVEPQLGYVRYKVGGIFEWTLVRGLRVEMPERGRSLGTEIGKGLQRFLLYPNSRNVITSFAI